MVGPDGLGLGERVEAMRWYQEALLIVQPDAAKEMVWTWWPSDRPRFVSVLGGLEAACADVDEFRAFCRRCQETGIAGPAGLQWHLEPALGGELEPAARRVPVYAAEFAGRAMPEWLAAGWEWLDPLGDCTAVTRSGRAGGLILEAANGRDLYWINYTAPRLVRPATGDLIAEAVCSTAYDDHPAMGGLLLWRDADHYLLLDWGRGGPNELLLEGCLDGVDRVWGRGYLPGPQITLRLSGPAARWWGFCSADGETWFSVGRADSRRRPGADRPVRHRHDRPHNLSGRISRGYSDPVRVISDVVGVWIAKARRFTKEPHAVRPKREEREVVGDTLRASCSSCRFVASRSKHPPHLLATVHARLSPQRSSPSHDTWTVPSQSTIIASPVYPLAAPLLTLAFLPHSPPTGRVAA